MKTPTSAIFSGTTDVDVRAFLVVDDHRVGLRTGIPGEDAVDLVRVLLTCAGNGRVADSLDERSRAGRFRDVVDVLTEKVASVIAAGGYDAVLIFNRTGSDACDGSLGMSVAGNIYTFGVAPRGQGFAIFDIDYDNAKCLDGLRDMDAVVARPGWTGLH